MAEPKAPAEGATPPAPAEPAKVIPKFNDVVAESTARRRGEIAEAAGLPQPTELSETAAPTEPAKQAPITREDYDKWWNAQPETMRQAALGMAYQTYNEAIGAEYGDVLPTLLAAKENPALRAVLVELGDSTKKELLDLIADPEIRKHAKDLTKAEVRDFLLGEALSTYTKYAVPVTPTDGSQPPTPAEARIAALESQIDEDRIARDMDPENKQGYIQVRAQDVRALKNQFAHLTPEQIGHVVEVAEGRYAIAAQRAGIDTTKQGWEARAMRAGVKHPGYRDYGAQYSEVLGKQAPPAAPATTPTGTKGAAAPRDATEARRAAGVTALKEFKSKSPAFRTQRS